jgi:tight adherence protein C
MGHEADDGDQGMMRWVEFQMYSMAFSWIDRFEPDRFFPQAVAKIKQKMAILYGIRNCALETRKFLARLLLTFLSFLLFIAVMGFLLGGDLLLWLSGFIVALIFPYLLIQDIDRKMKKRRQKILLEIPELLNKITLLVNAGETMQQAILKCTERSEQGGIRTSSPLLQELSQVANAVSNNYSFQQAMEEFNKRCGVQEVSIFVTTVLLNYRRGGDELVLTLRELARELWEKRKALIRTLGEEASSKLVFPMVLVFLVVMVIVAAPAAMLIN